MPSFQGDAVKALLLFWLANKFSENWIQAKELNAMSATAESIHRPWMNTFMGKWKIKSNCFFSYFRQSILHAKEVGV